MCGLVGVIGEISHKEKQVFEHMLFLDTFRGPHSTGVATVNSKGEVDVLKKLGTPWELVDTKKWSSLIAPFNLNVLMGHNRWATRGRVTQGNAHPFTVGTVTGCHNGTLTTTFNLDDNQMFEVDSENIMHHINRNGIEATLPELRGAYALTVYDEATSTFYLARNQERTLHYAFSEDGKTLFYASEAWMIQVACAKYQIKCKNVNELPVGSLFKFDFNEKQLKPRVSKFKVYTPPPVQSFNRGVPSKYAIGTTVTFGVDKIETQQYGNQVCIICSIPGESGVVVKVWTDGKSELRKLMETSTNFFTGEVSSYGNYAHTENVTVNNTTVKEVVEDHKEKKFYVFAGEEVGADKYKQYTKAGCAFCGSPVSEDDAPSLLWVERYSFFCEGCVDTPFVKEYV